MMTFFAWLITFLLFIINVFASNNWDPSKIHYPVARRANTSFDYESLLPNGTIVNVTVGDPYNWLEQDVDKSNETKAFVEAEMALTQSYLEKSKDLSSIRTAITHLYEYVDISGFHSFGPENDRHYLYKILLTNASRATWYLASAKEMEKGFNDKFSSFPGQRWFDENLLSKDGSASIVDFIPSDDGKLIAYEVDFGGGDVATIYVRNISSPLLKLTGDPIPGGEGRLSDVIPQHAGGGVYWNSDNSGFTYAQDLRGNGPTGGYQSRIRYHIIGTPYEDDITIVDFPKNPFASWGHFLTADKQWILVRLTKDVDFHAAIYVTSLIDQPISGNMTWQSIAPDLSTIMFPLGNLNSTFFFATDANALNGKVVSVEVDRSKAIKVTYLEDLVQKLETKTFIPEKPQSKLEIYDLERQHLIPVFDTDKLLLYYMKNATYEFYLYDLKSGKELTRVLPEGKVTPDEITTQQITNELFLITEWINKPNSVYRLSWNQEQGELETKLVYDAIVESIDFNNIVTEQHYSISKDRTKVPFTVFYEKGALLDGSQSTLLYFYGQYGLNSVPAYAPRFLDWILGYGGNVAMAYPRGGGENGEQWHIDGMLAKRQNTVDDVISVIESLVEKKFSGLGKTLINGGSAAGTTCMVVSNQAPEGLHGGAICDRGVYDMLRFTVMQISGPANTKEFGDPNNASDFTWLERYSPLDNVNASKVYPFVLLYGTANDDRVSPTNNYKMIAELQHDLPNNTNPLFLYIQGGQGHSGLLFSRNSSIEGISVKTALAAESLGLIRKNVTKSKSS